MGITRTNIAMKAKRVTLQDLANHLGISKAAVSMALKGDSQISKATQERVTQTADQLGYVYNRRAAALSTGKTHTVGLAIHDVSSPYSAVLCRTIQADLAKTDRIAFLANTLDQKDMQTPFVQAMIEHNADGLIISPAAGTTVEDIDNWQKKGLTVVNLVREIPGANCDYVGNDDVLALTIATRHILSLGHKNIVMLGGHQDTSTSYNRRLGYRNALAEAGIEATDSFFADCDSDPEAGAIAIKQVMAKDQPPTAIVCFTDLIALGVLSGLIELGLEPGKDVAVIGCDGLPNGARAYTQLTTMNVQKQHIGEIAAQMICNRIDNPNSPIQRVILEPELIIRKSCGAKFKH